MWRKRHGEEHTLISLNGTTVEKEQKEVALAGNRTRASRVAGENSTTEPPMLTWQFIFFEGSDWPWPLTKLSSRNVFKNVF